MPENRQTFSLDEVLGVLIRCKKCGSPVIEATIPQLPDVFHKNGCCRFCGEVAMIANQDLLADLGKAIEGLKKYQHLEVRLLLPPRE
jgi:hypothetical protein